MSSKLIIVADLQRFKLFTTKIDPVGREAVVLLDGSESLEIHQRLREKISDQQGNFKGVGASGSGEDHNLGLEEERRRIKEIAAQINKTVQEHEHKAWYLAAPKAINKSLVEMLDPAVQKSMTVNLTSDLTKTPDDELLSHFNS